MAARTQIHTHGRPGPAFLEVIISIAQAAVVRIIFEKYVNEGFGAQRIATYLNCLGYRARTGKNWHHATIRGIICNLTQTVS